MHKMHAELFEKSKLISNRKFAVIVVKWKKGNKARALERIHLIACNYLMYISIRERKGKEHTK